ncbi:hypothetical protein E2C01_075316 [Portunus trituberculatus]|uniref:Uncharacterized protein n=1 Tax=Portunus trituberculatus TaxID=210409 RepID=A0A5B7IIU1_PORTR|nr:hypothetical protein [Portunus trituberculatus]
MFGNICLKAREGEREKLPGTSTFPGTNNLVILPTHEDISRDVQEQEMKRQELHEQSKNWHRRAGEQ